MGERTHLEVTNVTNLGLDKRNLDKQKRFLISPT